MGALESLAIAKAKADARGNFERFIAGRHAAGWSETDIAEYRESIRVLMGNDDSAALGLFPVGAYATAEQARQAAREYWVANSQPVA
ncbi:MAG: hypothetical protein L6Q55_03530 [Azonexus sp.]|nr:hypothetical protein [Azonexus sp.]MCK6411477.1 hypothetical protein [Azonexus sp.]